MIRILVTKTAVRELKGDSAKTGKPYHMRFQNAYAYTVDREGNTDQIPEKFEINLDRDAAPYPVGEYTLAPSALYVDQNGRLACAARLTPITAKSAPATAR